MITDFLSNTLYIGHYGQCRFADMFISGSDRIFFIGFSNMFSQGLTKVSTSCFPNIHNIFTGDLTTEKLILATRLRMKKTEKPVKDPFSFHFIS